MVGLGYSADMSRPANLGDLRASGWESRPVKEEVRANAIARIAAGEAPVRRRARLRGHGHPPARERAARGARHHLPRRARPGEDAHDPLAHPAARRVDADRRGQRDQRRPLPPGVAPRAHARGRARRRHADRVGAPRPPLRREAGDAGHLDRRPHRRGGPDQGRRGPLPLRRADDPLRPRAAHQPRHLRDQRAPRPRRAHPGRPAERARGARRPDPGLQDPPAARRHARRVGEPRGLHEPRPDHHAAEGPLRLADPHPLPARRRDRDGRHRAGGAPARRRRARRAACRTS